MICQKEEHAEKMRTLEFSGYEYEISTGHWTKANRETITAHEFWFHSEEWIIEKIEGGEYNEKTNA